MLVLLTKCAVSCGFGHIYWRNTEWKTSFLVQCFLININNSQKQDSQVFESIGRALKNFFKFTGKKICDVAVFKNNCSSRSFYRIPPAECIWILLITEWCLSLHRISIRLAYCVKTVRIRSCSGPYFPASGLNTESYGVSVRIQSECEKIRTRITPNTGTFHAVRVINKLFQFS